MDIEALSQKLKLGEDQDIEFKSAAGGLPGSLWETLSAFANTVGGTIVLGVSENEEFEFHITGVRSPRRLLKHFWDSHNNLQKLSTPICAESDVRIATVDGHPIIVIQVPCAHRTQRPVYINHNPVTGTYKRNYEGDYHCTRSELQQMLRDANDDPQDSAVLAHFGLQDLDAETIAFFRNRFDAHNHDHPFMKLEGTDFLRALGAWNTDSEFGREGPTLAGMLMFGRELSLLKALPYYHVDYQEQKSNDPEVRWTYRITTDGRWEANLFKFYLRVYLRLVEDVDVPFQLDENSVRVEETHVHQALREALINTLVHANHHAPLSITVIKRRHAFIFGNPGRLRISRAKLYEGGHSSPRNPNLQKMFLLLGLGEKSGAGFQKILRAWREQEWLSPLVEEDAELETTRISLPIASMIPEDVERELRYRVGDAFRSLDELDRVILMLAHRFGEVANVDVQPFRFEHSNDIGERLKRMVTRGWLTRGGWGRGTKYRWILADSQGPAGMGAPLQIPANPQHNEEKSPHWDNLWTLAATVRERGRADPATVRRMILQLCAVEALSLAQLTELLDRTSASIQNHYLIPMVREGALQLLYPDSPGRHDQAYVVRGQNG
jgi:ATP-dependent DNA helicase RecG